MHEGHRKRLKEKLITAPSSLQPHEILEILLFYAIPRKNTNEIAHKLLTRFEGSVSSVFNADMEVLKSVDGIGENTACFLKTISKILDLLSVEKPITARLSTPMDTYKVVKSLFENANKEIFVVFYLGNNDEILGRSILSSETRDYVNLDLQEINRLVLIHKPLRVLVAHNHLSGSTRPSPADNDVTKKIAILLNVAGVGFYDHFIFCGENFYSYYVDGKLSEIENEIKRLLTEQ